MSESRSEAWVRERLDDLDCYFEALIGDIEAGYVCEVAGVEAAREILTSLRDAHALNAEPVEVDRLRAPLDGGSAEPPKDELDALLEGLPPAPCYLCAGEPHELNEEWTFCPVCGKRLPNEPPAPAALRRSIPLTYDRLALIAAEIAQDMRRELYEEQIEFILRARLGRWIGVAAMVPIIPLTEPDAAP